MDPMVGNTIDDKNAYMWFMRNRDRVNYQMKDFSDPFCDIALSHVISYFNKKELVKLYQFYNNTDYSICFDTDHTILAIPYKKIISIFQRINSNMIITTESKHKLIETNKLLFDLGISIKDIKDLIK